MANTLLNMPPPANAGDTRTLEGGDVYIVVDVNGTLVWRRQVLQVGRNQLAIDPTSPTTAGRVLTLGSGNLLETALQGELSRAGVIFSDPVPQTGAGAVTITNQQTGFRYFLYDVSALRGQPARTELIIRAVNSTLRQEQFIEGTDASVAPYYTFNY